MKGMYLNLTPKYKVVGYFLQICYQLQGRDGFDSRLSQTYNFF
jgi:hypothetical protein